MMQYGTIEGVNKPVSRIFFGTAFPLALMGGDGSELFTAALDAGINAFDTARSYGNAERSLGNWLETSGRRDEVVLLSKCGHPDALGKKRINEREMRADLQKSLSELHTDYIDVYLLHRDDPETEVGTVVEAFNAMHAEGKIGAFGGSNWTHTRIETANEYAYRHNLIPFTASSPNFGLAEQINDPWGGGCVTVSGPENEAARAWYRRTQMPLIAYSSLGRGLFSGKLKSENADRAEEVLDRFARKGYACPENFERLRRAEILANKHGCTVPQIAMAWLFRNNMNVFAVATMSKPERIAVNAAALTLALTAEEAIYLNLEREDPV